MYRELSGVQPMGSQRVGQDCVVEHTADRQIDRYSLASLVAQLVKNPHAMQETSVQFLG